MIPWDFTRVNVVTPDGARTTVFSLDARDPSQMEWVSSGIISLSAFAGKPSP